MSDDLILDEAYPARRILTLIANKWTPIVLYCLGQGTGHFGKMQRQIPGISKKMLAQVLRGLERDGLVTRKVFRSVPPKTEYTITDLGRRIHEPVMLLCDWALENADAFDAMEQHRAKTTQDTP
ncbi:helix-turn-helix domain-containing protein [uncultured Roseobacter sp.]|uniref:winged helix-turn-helix transcriptional regulator n=1 Tax=uncultured Roseobacter sp. TaxID=114847 RepID=UPI0026102455|nr:helix-turn-helix domain-containing protein [uncultured Roseobacter sp.]